jgi:hypothetical protein
MLEAAKAEVVRDEGQAAALHAAVKRIADVIKLVDKDLDADAFAEIQEPLQVASAIKKYIAHITAILESGAKSADDHKFVCQGRVQALELMIGNMKKLHSLERLQAAQHLPTEVSVSQIDISRGVALPLKERRRLEEEAEKAALETPITKVRATRTKRSKKA